MTASHHILGQSRALRALGCALASGNVHHAWIFHGPAGVGKFRTAEEFARILLDPASTASHRATLQAPRDTPCARLIDAGTHPDFHVIRKELAAISESRELRDRKQMNIPLELLRERMLGGVTSSGRHHESGVFRTASLGHGKVFIIDEAELLDADGQNAMLKTLEEPPAGTTIVLVTQQEDRLLPTIRSRCQRVAFGPLGAQELAQWWNTDGPSLPEGDRAFIEAFAEGSPGMAARAVQHGIAAWNAELSPLFDALESGRYPPGLSDRMAEIADEFAKAIVDADDSASKEAANRLGVRLLAQLLGLRVRRALAVAAASNDTGALERWIGASEILSEFEQHVRSAVNLKHAFANLVAQWVTRLAPQQSATGAGRGR
ncbi:MAG: DNA polymerase III subunit delta' [Phycisphaerales bacterium]|nr:DNA polymerase III subunit delta' [Phycisphaerales bacterium]